MSDYRDPRYNQSFAERQKARDTTVQHPMSHAGKSFSQWDKEQRLKTGTLDASSEAALSESDRADLVMIRQALEAGSYRGAIPQHLQPFLPELNTATAPVKSRTLAMAAALTQWQNDAKRMDAATATETQPLSRELSHLLTGQTTPMRAEHFYELCHRMGFADAYMALSLEGYRRGLVVCGDPVVEVKPTPKKISAAAKKKPVLLKNSITCSSEDWA